MESEEFEQQLPEDLEQAAEWLRAQRPEGSALDLDRIKQRARAQAMRRGREETPVARPRRTLSTALATIALTVGLGGAVAVACIRGPLFPLPSPSSHHSAAHFQYKPGKGCGDKNHQHEREDECKPPKPKPPPPPPPPPKPHKPHK